jgi:uncharacterized membrane protein
MSLSWPTLAAILAMAAATYLCRAGGYALLRATRTPPFVEAMLRHLPGALFAAYVAPAMVGGGVIAWTGAAAVVAVQLATRNMGLAIVAGVAVVWAVKAGFS